MDGKGYLILKTTQQMENQNGMTNQNQETTKNTATNKERENESFSHDPRYDWKSGSEYLDLSQKRINNELEAMRQRQLRSKGEPKKIPYDPKLSAYFDSLHDREYPKIEYGDARIEFYLIWKEVIFGDRDIDSKPFIDPSDAWIIREFVKWIIRDETCELDLNKGLLMTGTQGCGKTTLMKCGLIFLDRYTDFKFKMKRINDVMFEVEKEKSITVIEPYFIGNWCFDDIGQMNEDVVAYSKYNVVEMLINKRINSKYFTMATTNLEPTEMREKYGKVVTSRMNEMFNALVFGSEKDCRTI